MPELASICVFCGPDAQKVFGWTVADDGELVPIGAFAGVPATVAGLAAS
jgi:hypothetical protein